jgi:hypothetical protein
MNGPDACNHDMCIYIRDLRARIVSFYTFIKNQKNLCACKMQIDTK